MSEIEKRDICCTSVQRFRLTKATCGANVNVIVISDNVTLYSQNGI